MARRNSLAAGAMIAVRGLSKRYAGGAVAVDDVGFEVAAGSLTALIGGSGAGKTTTLKCVNRLVEPDAGEVLVDGRRNDTVAPASLRRGIGYVFQNIGLFPHMTVAENIAVTPRLLAWSEADIAARTAELLDLVALPQDHGRRFPAALSGGERQRVGVARALAARPKIVLMDEPFGALDPLTRSSLGEAYRALHDRLGLTTLMVTHDVEEAVLLADRIVVMDQGRVVAHDTPRALLAGHADPIVTAMMAAPRRRAEKVQALLGAR